MICVRLDGGLGNQLFQYAAGRVLARCRDTELLLDLSSFSKKRFDVTPRNLELDQFNHIGLIVDSRGFNLFPWLHVVAPVSRFISRWSTYVEKKPNFDKKLAQLPDQTYLIGYWQSHRYFSEISNELLKEFSPVNELSLASRSIEKQMEFGSPVALHVRRGDYVSLKSAASFHGALPLSYYMAAVTRVRECVANPRFFVFSDDPEWCRSNLQLGDSAVFVDHNLGADSWQDLVLMGRCRHHVIANSSFSWWGAWLADQRWGVQQRLVIAPARWFNGRTEAAGSDRFPAHWEVLVD